MNKRIVRIFLMTLLGILFLNVADVYASGSSYSRARIYLKSGSPTAGGKVYVGKAATSSPSYKNCTSTTSAASSAEVEGANKTTTYHFYAQANAGYKFTGWYTKNNNDEYTLASTEAHYSVAVTSGAAPSGMDNSYTDKNLYASFVKIIQLSFVTPTNGSYTITHDGAAVSDYASFTVDGTVKLQAFPDAGYRLKGWYTTTNGGATKSYFAFGDECEPNFTANTTIGAEFEPDDGKAQFWVQGTNYVTSNLAAANTKAESSSSKKIIVVNSGSIPTGTFTISSGVTLLIPYGSDYSKITEPNNVHITGIGSAPELKVYKKLTLAPGAIIDCSGSICVGGQVMAINGGNPTSLVRGSVGVLDLSLGGTVNLKSGSKLYAWGFVQGQNMNQGNNTSNVGEIIAESGSNVYEVFQCGEWRGGTASQTIYNNRSSWKFFPFQSYTIQNIEAPITLKNGAKETCYWTIYGNGQTYTVKPDLIGSSGLFVLGTGASLKKWYDPTTDRVCYAMSGSASLGAISITLSGMTISSGDYNLPIPANMHIIVNSGTTTIGKPMVMHAGSVVEIKSGATLQLNSNCYMFDQTDWSTYCMYAYYFRNYANLTAHYDRDATYAGWNYSDGKVKTQLEDARLVVDGTLKFGTNGRLYSSTNGSAIVGNGGGQVQFGTLPGTTTIVMCKELSNNTSVSVSNANLCNDDGSYTKAIASTTFKNVNGRWFTSPASTIKSNHTYDFTYIKSGAVYGTGGTNTTVAAVYSHDKTGILDRMKWANVKADVCDNWWAGLNDTYLYNWTLHSAWHQFQPTGATIGEGDEVASIYSGSDNKLYTKLDCAIEEYGGTDANCLYTVGGVQKAFVNGALVALVKNTNDEAYHKSDAATTYYICFSEGCNWHPATKVASTNKAYTVDGQDYIWYDGAWLAATKDGTFYYSLDEHNVRIYYEYVSDAWTLASPVAETTRSGNTLSWFKIADAFSDANTGTGPGTATTIKLLKNVSVSTALNYTGNGNTILDLNGYTLSGTVTDMITLNAANAVLIVIDQSAAGKGKIQLSYSANSRRYGVNVTKGHLILNSGTIYAENTMAYNSTSATTTTICAIYVNAGQKFTMNGGTVTAEATYNPFGIYSDGANSIITINGGTINCTSTSKSSPYAIISYGTINVHGGTINATAETTTAVGIYVNASTSKQGTLNMTGGTINAVSEGGNTAHGIIVNRGLSYQSTTAEPRLIKQEFPATAHISGGTVNVSTTKASSTTAMGISSYGTTEVSGGEFVIRPKATTGIGVRIYGGTTTISGNAHFDVQATESAYGVRISEETPNEKGGPLYNGTLIMNGGKLDVKTTTGIKAYGVYVGAVSRNVTTTHASDASFFAGNYANAGTATINDGEINATAKTTDAYAVFVEAALSGTFTGNKTPKLTINGGKFKVASNAASPTGILLCNSDAATANFVINGGYYNLAASENATTGTDDGKTIYPNLSINKYKAAGKVVKELDAEVEASLISAGYGCKVAGKEYTVTFKTRPANGSGWVITTIKVEKDKIPVYPDGTPIDYASSTTTARFSHWRDITDSGNTKDYKSGLPAVGAADVIYQARYTTLYAQVSWGGNDSIFTSAKKAWAFAITKQQATIRLLSNVGTEASVGNMTQLVFNPTNANSTITFDLNGHSWVMGNNSTASENKNVFLNVSPEQANCKLIITDNSASGNGYLMNKNAYDGVLYCANVANGGELILQGGGLRVSNTSDASAAKYGIGLNVASGAKFTMTGGTIYSTDVYSPRGMNVSSGGTADIAGGTIEANTTTGHAYAILPYGTVSVGGTALIKAVSTNAAAYTAQTQGTLNIDGGTFEATAASNARTLFAYVGGKITVDGNPTIKAEVTSGSEAYPVYSHTTNSEVVINGGSFTSTGISTSGSIMGIRTVSDGVVTVNDGTFTLNGGSNWTFGAFVNGGTVNLNGGTFNVNQASGGNVEAVRVYPDGTCNISGGTYTVNATANTTNGNALCAFGGTANITGNPVFTAYKGIDIATAVVTNGDQTATVSVDGGTYITSSYALRSIKTTRADATYTGSITGDVTVWDGKFFSSSTEPVHTSSGTSYLKIRGGYYSTYTTDNVAHLSQYVVSPSTVEAYATTIDGKAYTYRVNTKYNVTFSVNGVDSVKQYNRNETPSYGSTPAINDGNTYDFIGWYTAADGSGDTIAPVTTDVTYYAVFRKYEAEVIEGEASSGTRYESFTAAFAAAQNMPVATIKILSQVYYGTSLTLNPDSAAGARPLTIDLNNHIVNYTAATATYALTINKVGCKLIITDSSVAKGGQFGHRQNASKVELLGIYVQNGELQLAGGTIIAKNTCTDGESGAGAKAIVGGGANSIFNMTGGTLLAQSRLGARAYNSSGDGVFNATGGDIIATTEYTESSTTKWGANAYGVILWNYGTFNMSGTTKISVTSGSGAIGVYPYGGDKKGYPVANISGGSISCLTKTEGTARSVNVHGARATVNISGGDITANGPAGQYNIEDVSVHYDAVANITGGNFHSTTGANCVGVRVFGGTATISSNAFFDSQRGVVVGDWAEAATATATAYINGGTFDCPVFAVLSMSNTNKYDKTNDGTVTGTTYVNGGYFKTVSGQNICSTSSEAGRLILNGGYYNETSGTTQKSNITTYIGSTTQVNTLSPAITVDGRTYHYELKTKFNVTWKGGTSYNKEEELWSGTMPSNAECTSFVRNDSTFYFTGWSPVPSPVITDITYNAEGVYHAAKVKIGSGEWTIYDDFNEAWTAAMAATNATVKITLLNNVTLDDYIIYNPAIANARTTLDLNNFKLEENNKDYVIIVNKADAKLTITDNSKDKGGCISKKRANTFNMYAVEVYHGEVIVAGGKVYCESTSDGASWQPAIAIHNGRYDDAKITVNGGTVEAKGLKQAHGINAYGNVNITGGHVLATITKGESAQALILSCGTATISGGTLEGKAVGTTAKNVNAVYTFGWIGSTKESASNATVNITGGTFLTTTEYSGAVTLQASGVTKLINEEYVAAHGIINVSGDEVTTVTAKGSSTKASQIFAVQVHANRVFDTEKLGEAHQIIAESKGEVNISGGKFLVDTRNNGAYVDNDDNIDLLRSWGTLNVTGGTFTIYQMVDPVGVSVYRGKTTISGNPVFNVNCYTQGRGVIAGSWSHSTYCDKDASKNLAEVEVNGGTFNVTSETGTAYGAWAYGGLSTASTTGDAGYAMNAKMTINGGEFVCLSNTENSSINPLRQENTRSGTYGDATAQLIVNGGKFKSLKGTTASNTATGYNIHTPSGDKITSLTGGYYANDNQLAAHIADTCDLITLEETDPEYANGYRYKIEPHYVAKVSKAGAPDRLFCIMKDAFDYAKTQDNSTITLLRTVDDYVGPTLYYTTTAMSCTLDLNGFTFKGQSTGVNGSGSEADRLLIVSKGGCTFTIKDSSPGKTGKFSHEKSGANFAVVVYHGTLVLESGTVHCKNTSGDAQALRSDASDAYIQVTGGKVHAEASATAYGVYANNASSATISGGEIFAEGTESAYGVNSQGANADIQIKGTAKVKAKIQTAKKTCYGVKAAGGGKITITGSATIETESVHGCRAVQANTNSTITISGDATINANSDNHAYGIYAEGTSAKITVEAGTINSKNATADGSSITAYANSSGNIEINGGTFTATRSGSGTSNVQTVRTANNATMIINGGTFNGSGYQAVNIRGGETTINGGTFNAAVGISAMDWADDATITGKLTVKGGTFNTTAQTIYVSSMANNSRNAHSEVTIEGGKFNSTGSTIVQMNATPAGADPSTLTITGGYFNEKSGTTYRTQIANYIADTCKITDITSASVDPEYSNGYRYRIDTDYQAKVTVGGSERKFALFKDAFYYARTQNNATITLLRTVDDYAGPTLYYNSTAMSCTLDLNGFTFKGQATSETDRLFIVNKTGCTFTIKDSSPGKTGKFIHENSGAVYAVVVYHGTLVLESGTVHCKNTSGNAQALRSDAPDAYIQVTGGKAHAEASAYAYGVYANNASSATISGGLVLAEGSNAYGAHSVNTGSKVTVSGGKIKAIATNTAYGISVETSSSATVNGADSIYAKANNTRAYTVYANAGTVTIEGTPAFYAESPNGARVLESVGTASITVNDGLFEAKAGTDDSYAVCAEGTSFITVNGGKFKTNNTNIAWRNANSTLTINGGYFNEYSTGTNHKTQVETYKGSGKEVMTLDSDEAEYIAGYRYLVTSDPVAKVKAGSEVTYHTTIADAIAAANELTDPTVTMLKDVTFSAAELNITTTMTLDLNGKTVKSTRTASTSSVFKINADGITLTITDSGTGGKIDHTASVKGKVYGINVAKGTLKLEGGTIYAKNTIDTTASYGAYGINSADAAKIYISNGSIEAWAPNNTNAYGIESSGELTMTGGTVYANSTSSARGIRTRKTATISNATITAETTAGNCMAVYNYSGTTTINSGTYTADGTTDVYAVYLRGTGKGTTIVNGGNFRGPSRDVYAPSGTTATLQGGYYVHSTGLDSYCADNYHVLPASLTEGKFTYSHKVAEAYTLTWTTDGDALTGTYTSGLVEPGAAITAPATPTKTGYTFSAWSPAVAATMPAEDKTYTAQWTVNSYTIRFLNYDGTVLQTGSVNYGETPAYNGATPTKPADAEYAYTFAGWDNTLVAVTGDATYTATYNTTPVVASLTVNKSGNKYYYTDFSEAFNIAKNSVPVTITLLKDASCSEALEYDGSNTDCTLDLNGHTLTSNTSQQSPLHINKSNATFTITDGTDEKSGKLSMNTSSSTTIFGAYVQSGTLLLNAGTIEVLSGSATTCGVTVHNGSLTMEGGTIHVKTTDGREGRGVYAYASSTTINGGTIHVEAAGDGYGIKRDNNGTGTVTVNNGKFNISATGSAYATNQTSANANVVIRGGYYTTNSRLNPTAPYHVFDLTGESPYRYEVAEGYTLTWNLGGGTVTAAGTAAAVNATGTPNGYVKAGATITAPTVTRTGYTFSAWSPAVAATMPAANTTYAATWTAKSCTVTFDKEGGSGGSDNVTATYGSAMPAITAPTRTGYTFGGYYDGDNGTGTQYYTASGTSARTWDKTANTTLYAKWTSDTYTISYALAGGSVAPANPTSYTVESSAITLNNPTRPGYVFAGWTGTGLAEATATVTIPAGSTGNRSYTATWTPAVASVTINTTTTYYTTLADAFEKAKTGDNALITMLQDVEGLTTQLQYNPTSAYKCTLDLHNHKVEGTIYSLLYINKSKSTFTITDNSAEKKGRIGSVYTGTAVDNATRYGVYVNAGNLVLEEGTIYFENRRPRTDGTSLGAVAVGVNRSTGYTFTMNGGTVEAKGNYRAYGVYSNGTTKINNGGTVKATVPAGTNHGIAYGVAAFANTTTINAGATITVEAPTAAYGVASLAGTNSKTGAAYEPTLTVEGGTINVTTTTGKNAYGAYTVPATRTITKTETGYTPGEYGAESTLNIHGGTFNVTSHTSSAYGVYVGLGAFYTKTTPNEVKALYQSSAEITGGTFYIKTDETTGTTTAEGVRSYGTTIISGGTFDINANTNTAYGVHVYKGKTTINGNPSFIVRADSTVYGASAGETPNDQTGMPHDGELEINGGTFDVATTSKASADNNTVYGVRAYASRRRITKTESGYYIGNYASAGTVTVNGGEFIVDGNSAIAGIICSGTVTQAAATISGTACPAASATAKMTVNGGKFKATGNTTIYACNTSATPANFKLQGGWFNIDDGISKYVAPKAASPYYCVPTTAADKAEVGSDYEYKIVADANTGFHADIVDVDNSAKTLTLNVSMWGSSGWPYTINGVAYGKNSSSGQDKWREDDRTLILPYTGNAGDMFGIKVSAKNGTVVSDRLYTIPTAVTANTTLDDQQVLYVKRGATLTVTANKTVKNIYVAPGAKLVINSGKTLTADTVFLRTEAWESAELENNGTVTAQICYTRIVKDESRYFQFGLPYDCPVSSVRLSSGHTIAYQGGWLLRSYSESSRATNGANGNNWQTLTDGTIRGCTGYEMFSAFGYYREFYFPVTPTDNTSVSVTRTGDNKAHSGWNIIVSPLMRAYRCDAVPEGPVASWLTEDGSYWQRPIEEIKPAIPFSYQAKGSGIFSFGATMAAPAPRRVAATDEPTRIQWIQLEIADAEGNGDQAGIYSHPTRYDETYQTGIDVAKQSFEASRALLYTVHAYGDMAFAGVADSLLERGIPVTVYSPAGQELTFSLRENDWLDRLAEVWLIDNETGTRTDLLRDDYSFLSKAGATAGRFVIMGRFFAPGVATGIMDAQGGDAQGAKAQKVLVDDKMYILINGRTYDATGKLVTNDNNK